MDGNSSWALLNKRPKMEGYLKGMQNMSKTILNLKDFNVVDACRESIEYIQYGGSDF